MRRLYSLILIAALVFSAGCASNKNKPKEDPAGTPALQKRLDIGTISSLLEVVSIPDEGSTIQVKVKEVLGYGASTQPLALDKILSLSIPESLDTLMLEKLSAGDTFSAVIKKMPAMMGSDRNKENWNLVELIKQ